MLYKILGLVLIVPFISYVYAGCMLIKHGSEMEYDEYIFCFVSAIVILLMIEAFGVGLYFLFK